MLEVVRRLVQVSFVAILFFRASGFVTADDPPAAQNSNSPPANVSAPSNPIDSAIREPAKIQEIAAAAKKSVVVVTFSGRDGSQQGMGSGFIVSSNGLIATNLHVIGEAREIRVQLYDGRKFDVTAIHATERSQDLAVLKIDATDLPTLPLGNSDELQEGQPVIAIGNPLGLERSVVAGVLSARREIDGRQMLQLAVPIERGNSGGPLLDLQGRVHGLLTLKSLKTDNLGFAISVNALKPLLEKPNPIPMSRWLTIGAMDPDEWTVVPGGRWRQRAGHVSVEGRGGTFGGRALCLAKESPPEVPFEMAVQVKFTPSDGAAGLVIHSDGGDKHYGFYPTNGSLRFSRFDGPDVYSWVILREVRNSKLNRDGWNLLKVRVEADRILCYLNRELVFEINDTTYTSGKVGLCKFRQTEADFKGFRLGMTIDDAQPTDDLLERVIRRIDAMTHDDASVSEAIHQLAQEEANVVDTIEQQAKSLESRAAKLRRIASDVHTKQTLTELLRVMKTESIDLLRAALLVAKLDNTELDINAYIQQMDRHAKRVKSEIPVDANEDQRFAALNRYLFDEQGFHGSRMDYNHRSNSYLNEVLDDREGIPITLSVVYIELAKRLGMNVVGVGMPTHFLARHEPPSGTSQLVDPFDRGRLLTPKDAQAIFEDHSDDTWDERFLNSINSTAIIERMLRNLFNAATETHDTERMLRYTEAILAINPNSVQDHFRCGVLCYQTERWQKARAEVEWLSTHDTNISRETIDELSRAIARESQK